MLQLTALPAAQTAPANPDAPASNGEMAQNGAAFGALLAALGQGADQAQPPADSASVLSPAAPPGGTILPAGGKELPDGIANSPLLPAFPEALPDIAALGLPMIPGSAMSRPDAALPSADTASDVPHAVPAPLASPRHPAAPDQAATALPMLDMPAAALPKTGRDLAAAARPVALARPVASLRVTLGEGLAEGPARPATGDLAAPPVPNGASSASPSSLALGLPASLAPATLSAGPLPPVEAIQRPEEFAQLIDRLMAAREAAAPQRASLSLAHAEFGRVDLTFASDGQGLSVNLSSPDPDFARAVQAASPPATTGDPATAGNRQSSQSDARHDGLPGQAQGQAGEQRQGRPADRPHSRQTMPQPERQNPETGIFA